MKRNMLYLLVLTITASLLLWVFAPIDGSLEKSTISTLFLPEISEQINAVDKVEIVTAGNSTVATLVRTKDHWQLEQMGGYPADWSKLQTLLAALAQTRIVELKTDKAQYYAGLGVEDVTNQDAESVLVELSIGEQTTGILVGHQAQSRPGQYVRRQNIASSVLIDRKLEIPTQQLDWADSTIIDVNTSEVAEVEIIHQQGERLLVTRISADQTDFDLVGLPQDREIKSSWAVNSLGSVLSMLKMESVQPDTGVDWGGAAKMRLLMFSGVEIVADVVESEAKYLLRLSASHPEADVVRQQPDDQQISAEAQQIESQALTEAAKNVAAINQKVAGWAYGISKQKYDLMANKLEDLLKPLEVK